MRDAGLDDRVTVLLSDYRDLRGRYDKLVSIEMIEAVGWQYFERFFRRCGELLRDDGLMLLQAITIDDRAYELEKASRSFIKQLIFPSGCLPSVEVICRCVARATDMRMLDLEDMTPHYPRRCAAGARTSSRTRAESRSSATTDAFDGSGSFTSRGARAASESAGSATCRRCSPGRRIAASARAPSPPGS